MAVELHGYRYGVCLRIAAMTLLEKGVRGGMSRSIPSNCRFPPPTSTLNPFGRVPTLVHDGFVLYETSAITRHVDEAFPGPALQPTVPASVPA